MKSDVEKIKERLDITDVIGSYVKLERAGKNLKGVSPFTNEKTPSFFVSPDRGLYHCFSSNKGGDIFTFVQEIEGLDFRGALKLLADKAGVQLTKQSASQSKERDRMFELMDLATHFYHDLFLKTKEAKDYLEGRGVGSDSVNYWRIGYSPDGWRSLLDFLRKKGFKDSEIEKVGLIKKRDQSKDGERYYDTFRDRILFPISDSSGRVVGFSGRILHDKENAPKYLNSPETPLYDKSSVLYGFDKAKTAIRKQDYSILVEGQMDLVMNHQAGLKNTVASSGTALTADQLTKLNRLSSRLIVAFDSDSAGFTATVRNAKEAMGLGMEVKIAELPEGEDPADLIKEDSSAWKEVLRNSVHIIDFYLNNLVRSEKDERKRARRLSKEVVPLLSMIESSIEKSQFISKIAERIKVSEEAVWDDLKSLEKADDQENRGPKAVSANTFSKLSRKEVAVREIVDIIKWQENSDNQLIDVASVEKKLKEVLPDLSEEMLNLDEEKKNQSIFRAEVRYGNNELLENLVEDLLRNLEMEVIKEEFTKTMFELGKAEKSGDQKLKADLLKKCQELSGSRAKLQASVESDS